MRWLEQPLQTLRGLTLDSSRGYAEHLRCFRLGEVCVVPEQHAGSLADRQLRQRGQERPLLRDVRALVLRRAARQVREQFSLTAPPPLRSRGVDDGMAQVRRRRVPVAQQVPPGQQLRERLLHDLLSHTRIAYQADSKPDQLIAVPAVQHSHEIIPAAQLFHLTAHAL